MRALVTGGTGFVGSHLVETLLENGHEVRILARRTSPKRWVAHLPVSWCWGDVTEDQGLREAVEEVDWVFHLAGLTKALYLREYLRVNAEGTLRILKACVNADPPPKRFVLMSSLAACGPAASGRPLREEDPCSPVSHYGTSKLEAERIANSFAGKIPVVILRPPAVYGPRDRDILAFFRLAKRGWNPMVGRTDPFVSMIHVKDLAQGTLLAAQSSVPSGAAFFLSDGSVHRWSEVVLLLSRLMEVRVRSIHIPFFLAYSIAGCSEVVCLALRRPPLLNRQKVIEMAAEAWTCEIQRAKKYLGFSPRISIESGLQETYHWYRKQGWL